MPEIDDTTGLLVISVLMLIAVLASATLTGFVPYASPAEVIQAFYAACNSRDYSVAERTLVPEASWVLAHHIGAVDGGLPRICDIETKQGHLQRVEILRQEIHGEIGRVRYRLHYADGTAVEDSQGLVMKHWAWRIAP